MTSLRTYVSSCQCPDICERWLALTVRQAQQLAAGMSIVRDAPAMNEAGSPWLCAKKLAESGVLPDEQWGNTELEDHFSVPVVQLLHVPGWVEANRGRRWDDALELEVVVDVLSPEALECLMAPWDVLVNDSHRAAALLALLPTWGGFPEELVSSVSLALRGSGPDVG